MSGNDRGNAGRGRSAKAGNGSLTSSILDGDKDVIRLLNLALKNELTAINQYFLHSRMLADWGVTILAKKEFEESVDEMKHADSLVKRLLLIGSLPNMQDLGRLRIGETVLEVLKGDLALEVEAIKMLKPAIAHCEKVSDYVSRELFEDILESEEEHIDFLQTQLKLIEQIGLENYIQLQSKPAEG